MESSNFISNWAPHHGKFEFDLASSSFRHFEDVPIENITDFSDKIILGVDEGQNFAIATEDAPVSLFSLSFCLDVLLVGTSSD